MLLHHLRTESFAAQLFTERLDDPAIAHKHGCAHLLWICRVVGWLKRGDDSLALLRIAILGVQSGANPRAKDDGIPLQQPIVDDLVLKRQEYGLREDGQRTPCQLLNGTGQAEHTVGMWGCVFRKKDGVFFERAYNIKGSSKPVPPTRYHCQIGGGEACRIGTDE